MVSTLSDEEHQRLLASDEFVAVRPNRQRFVQVVSGSARAGGRQLFSEGGGPRFPRFARSGDGGPRFPRSEGGGPSFPRSEGGGPRIRFAPGVTPDLMTYLAGQRDAIDSLMARLATPAGGGGGAGRPFRSGRRTGPPSGLTWGLSAVGVTGAAGQLTGRNVKVAVLDTGLDLTHPDWASRPVVTDPQKQASFVPGVASIMDKNGHGTHVAGTVAGPMKSVGGVRYGVAPDCDLHVGKVMADDGAGFDSDILDGIQWALDRGCRIINLSLGSDRDEGADHSTAYELIAERLMDLEDGALVVAAAGNASGRADGFVAAVGNPAACPSVLAVAALAPDFSIADFSCGQVDAIGVVDLAAPGVGVYSSFPVALGRFAELDGTSMAAPHVTGVAACLLQARPNLTPRQLWDRLRSAALPLPHSSTDVGRGLASLTGV